MSSNEIEPGADKLSPGDSPGRMVAAAREARGINPADLAVRLRLDAKIIKALERDDFENLPAPTFVKGYIRSIAKELDVESAPILAAYTTHGAVEPPSLADFSSRPPEQVGINSTVIKTATYGIVAVLVLLIGLWWQSNREADSDHAERRAVATEGIDDAPQPLPYKYEIIDHGDESWRLARPTEPTISPDGSEQALAPAAAANETQHELQLSTTSEAWIEIYDAQDNRLYFGMAKADKPVILSAQNYYRLILGNTDSISLRFDGKAIDLNPHAEQGVAQLELGEKPQTAPQ